MVSSGSCVFWWWAGEVPVWGGSWLRPGAVLLRLGYAAQPVWELEKWRTAPAPWKFSFLGAALIPAGFSPWLSATQRVGRRGSGGRTRTRSTLVPGAERIISPAIVRAIHRAPANLQQGNERASSFMFPRLARTWLLSIDCFTSELLLGEVHFTDAVFKAWINPLEWQYDVVRCINFMVAFSFHAYIYI